MGKHEGYSRKELETMPSQSDWARAAAMTDEEIEAADADDPEVAGMDDDWMARAVVTRSRKTRIYAAYDEYVIEYFKQGGRGYQARMNAVLKAYVDAQLATVEQPSEA